MVEEEDKNGGPTYQYGLYVMVLVWNLMAKIAYRPPHPSYLLHHMLKINY